MKTILAVILVAFALAGGACSRTEDQPAAAQATPNLKSDAERLQQATAKAAEERKRSQASESPTPAP